ncbi:hypothetical protein EOA78_26175 [Mesorhizobium sp. M5C.F.Cr.IN.023.01.1.1]|uniref:HpcH/HpaI aldolase family protein n=1 Tax=Mesorhizobium sp. M5C.F.Cr.IN.023.01.1.1 TaxID=2496768 RepID=UPI000FCCDE89|nr:aldolase/citrate lyase family protein [Mesorhizobium sp. M5C.F.Cr.IN.023.01.1.1]RUV68577.1 hypothetical protein EOA78_26175 [Mesorhizobium sp. M5C.F.Cr.IN.023.01.1.1]
MTTASARVSLKAVADLGPQLIERSRTGLAVGTFIIEVPTIATIRAVALAGFDFVVIDMEHSTLGFDRLEPLVLAAQMLGVAAFVRVWGEDVGLIGKALEAGANGILVPHVETAERVRAVVAETRFPPLGARSFSPLTRHDGLAQSKTAIGERTVVIVQIEGRKGLDAIAEIAGVVGIDGIFIGTHDLSGSLGIGVEDDALIGHAARLAGSLPESLIRGVYIDRPEASAAWSDLGFSLQCVSFDGRMLADGASAVVAGTSVRKGTAA